MADKIDNKNHLTYCVKNNITYILLVYIYFARSHINEIRGNCTFKFTFVTILNNTTRKCQYKIYIAYISVEFFFHLKFKKYKHIEKFYSNRMFKNFNETLKVKGVYN